VTLTDQLRAALARDDRVLAAYLFGSHARGTAGPHSDIDVAVLVDPGLPRRLGGPLTQIQTALELALGPFAARVDLIDLATAPADLVHRVLRDGELLVEHDRRARIEFEVRRRAEYIDLKPYLDEYRKAAIHD
jgi:uncharacterized protein